MMTQNEGAISPSSSKRFSQLSPHHCFHGSPARMLRSLAFAGALSALALLTACGGGGGGGSSSPAADPPATTNAPVSQANPPVGPNVVSVSIRQRTSTGNISTANTPFVTVTVCNSSTGNCLAVQNVLVDTGSAGLRLFANQSLNGLNLPNIATSSGGNLGACAQFASGYTWGGMRQAQVHINGAMTSGAIPIEIIGDPNVPQSAPQSCQNGGQDFSQSLSGVVNGILGISNFQYDCGLACAQSAGPGVYYSCGATSCTSTTAPLSSQGLNPIAAFQSGYNNGSILTLPAAPLPWGAQAATGTLVFGINTLSNNQLPANAQVFALDSSGNLSIAVNGSSGTGFIDSGSNGYYAALSLPACTQSTGFYCPSPAATVALQLSSGAALANTNITIANADAMFTTGNAALPALGGTAAISGQVDLGLPFFYGRSIFTVMQYANNNGFVAF
jgi:hypothetical protein